MQAGTQVGAYRVLQQIGQGGMGSVWLAEHTMLGRRAAIKLLHPMYSARPDIVTRFFNEARAATAIADPGIVQIFDFGQHVDGTAYIVMEMLEGEPLDQRLRRLGHLASGDALRIIRQAASTLGVAHARGIVHRDLKPENVFLVRDPEVVGGERAKILDFGIAKLAGEANVKTNTSTVMGTPGYMSPEQCRGAGHVDQRSDVYSLGCMLFALITGGPPFDAQGSGEVIAMHLREPPPAPSSRVFGIPPAIDALVLRCLAKDPAERYASGTELAAAAGELLASASHPGWQATGPGASHPPRGVVAQTTLSAANGATHPGTARWSRGAAFAAIGALVIVAGIVAVIAARRSGAGDAGSAGAAGSSAAAQATATTTPPPARPTSPPPEPPPPPPPDPNAELAKQMKALLGGFVAWSRGHAGAPCPNAATLGPVLDPWGHPLEITCTDQPANQVAGAVSAGPDGAPGTPDDIGSWQLGRDVTELVRGARWTAAAPPPPVRSRPRPVPRARSENDDIPTER
ncbi:MAG TPA: protein kinase [Kofleriaceae bacterium]|jgi:serine/threonine-protein kinase